MAPAGCPEADSRRWAVWPMLREATALKGAIAQQHLRSLLGYCNAPQMNAPEAYIRFTPGLIIGEGQVTNESTAEFLRNFMKEFHGFIVRVLTVLPRNG